MNTMKVNGTNVLAVFEMIEVQHYFRFVAEGLTFFLFNFSFTYTRQTVSRKHIANDL